MRDKAGKEVKVNDNVAYTNNRYVLEIGVVSDIVTSTNSKNVVVDEFVKIGTTMIRNSNRILIIK